MTPTMLDRMAAAGADQVMWGGDESVGLSMITIIGSTVRGPSLGGIRMHAYPSEAAALDDGFRLARAMTLKAAAAGLHLGGSATLVIGDPGTDKSEALLRGIGRYLATLGGRFIAVNDVGTTSADMATIGRAGAPVCHWDPSPFTAIGVVEAIRAARVHAGGSASLAGVHVAVQGAGNVGREVVRLLHAELARVTSADTVRERVDALAETGRVEVVPPEDILATACDVLAPCAMGSVVTPETIDRLRCTAIAGGANNVVEDPDLETELRARGIVYVPDFLANAGGVIALEEELFGHSQKQARDRARAVGQLASSTLQQADIDGTTTPQAARHLAERRIAARRRSLAATRVDDQQI